MKKILAVVLVLAMIFSFAACGVTIKIGGDSTEKVEEGSADPAVDEGGAASEDGIKLVELDPSTRYEAEGKFVINGMFADILTDDAVKEGWFYNYSTGTGEKVEAHDWEKAEERHTSCEVSFKMKNLEEKMTKSFVDRFEGVVVYNPPETFDEDKDLGRDFVKTLKDMAENNEGMEVFDLTPLQENPKQTDMDGYTTKSVDGVLLGKGQSAKQYLIADVSESFLRSWEKEKPEETLWAYFTYGEDVIFSVNLRSWMVDTRQAE